MPHITVELYEGRSDDEKRIIAEKVRDALCSQTGHEHGKVSVSVVDIPSSQWKSRVYDRVMEDENLVLEPDYEM